MPGVSGVMLGAGAGEEHNNNGTFSVKNKQSIKRGPLLVTKEVDGFPPIPPPVSKGTDLNPLKTESGLTKTNPNPNPNPNPNY